MVTPSYPLAKSIVAKTPPQLSESLGIGADLATEIHIVDCDSPARIKSEAASVKIAEITHVPTGSRMTSCRRRVNHGGRRQFNVTTYRPVTVRMQHHEPANVRAAGHAAESKTNVTSSARGTGARFGDSFGLGREAFLMGHNCPVFDRCQTA